MIGINNTYHVTNYDIKVVWFGGNHVENHTSLELIYYVFNKQLSDCDFGGTTSSREIISNR